MRHDNKDHKRVFYAYFQIKNNNQKNSKTLTKCFAYCFDIFTLSFKSFFIEEFTGR